MLETSPKARMLMYLLRLEKSFFSYLKEKKERKKIQYNTIQYNAPAIHTPVALICPLQLVPFT